MLLLLYERDSSTLQRQDSLCKTRCEYVRTLGIFIPENDGFTKRVLPLKLTAVSTFAF